MLFRGTSSTQYKGHVIRDVTRTADIMAGPENRLRPREPKETRDRPVSANTYTLTGDLFEYSHKIGPTCKSWLCGGGGEGGRVITVMVFIYAKHYYSMSLHIILQKRYWVNL